MNSFDYGKRAFLVMVFALSAACGGGGDGDGGSGGGNNPPPPPPPVNTGIGTAGGTVTEASGAKVVIPAGALTTNVDIQVSRTSSGAPALPAGVTAAGAVFAFTPHGTTFAVAATITVPFDPALVPGGATPRLYKTNASQTAFEPLAGATIGGASMSAQVTSFSFAVVASEPPLPPPGGLDQGFGNSGKVITHFGGKNTAMALQDDGKVVMVGGSITDFLLARYNADGSLDTTFDADGLVTTDIGSFTQEEARAVVVQPDGKIIVAGNIRDTRVVGGTLFDKFFFTLARYNTDGSLDTSFNQSGKLKSAAVGRAFAVALQSDGKIVAAGDDATDTPASTVSNARLARFNSDGSADTDFGDQGVVTTDTTAGDVDGATNILIQPDGAIVVSGAFSKSTGTGIARYLSSGTPDGNFGTFGTVDLDGAFVGEGLALQSDGKLVLVGSKQISSGSTASQFEVRRINADGTVDMSFGNGGTANTAFGTSADVAHSVVVEADGKIVVAGLANGFQFGVARYNADGSPDANFFAAGILKIESFGIEASADSVLAQPDGKILLGGFVRDSGGAAPGYGLVRINP